VSANVAPLAVPCRRCQDRDACDASAALVWVNDEPLCEPHALTAFLNIDETRGWVVEVTAPRAIDMRPVASRPTFTNAAQGGEYGCGACARCDYDAVVLVDDEPLCMTHYTDELAAIRARLFPRERAT
jgi:hypothetical protein